MDMLKKAIGKHPDYLNKYMFTDNSFPDITIGKKAISDVYRTVIDKALFKRDSKYTKLVYKIFYLAKMKEVNKFEYYMQRFTIPTEVTDNEGNTLLSVAVQAGCIKIAQSLIRRGAHVNT